jgi:endonuclease YncB( thermonuclease family)
MRTSTALAVLMAFSLSCASEALGQADSPIKGAAPDFEQLQPDETGKVTKVIDGDTLLLENGKQLRLVGIQAPKFPVGRRTGLTWPLAGEAKDTLEDLVLGQTISLFYGGARLDRHSRTLAQATDSQGRWLQGELLQRGLARVYSFADNRAMVAEMLSLERNARNARRGIWAHPFYAVRRHEDAEKDIGSFELVEGRVLKVAIVGGRAYLNFGNDWQRDFTLVIESAERRRFEAEGFDPAFYQGRRIRVRGWLGLRNGATMNVTHPEQIEVLDK